MGVRPEIDDIRNIADFAPMYAWILEFIEYPEGADQIADDLNLRCISADMPKRTGQTIEVNIRGHKVRNPGIYGYDSPWTAQFVETVENKVSQFLDQWSELCYESRTGKHATKAAVSATIKLTRLNRQNEPIWEYYLFGAFLESKDHGGQLGGDTNDFYKPTISLAYDYFLEGAPGTVEI